MSWSFLIWTSQITRLALNFSAFDYHGLLQTMQLALFFKDEQKNAENMWKKSEVALQNVISISKSHWRFFCCYNRCIPVWSSTTVQITEKYLRLSPLILIEWLKRYHCCEINAFARMVFEIDRWCDFDLVDLK